MKPWFWESLHQTNYNVLREETHEYNQILAFSVRLSQTFRTDLECCWLNFICKAFCCWPHVQDLSKLSSTKEPKHQLNQPTMPYKQHMFFEHIYSYINQSYHQRKPSTSSPRGCRAFGGMPCPMVIPVVSTGCLRPCQPCPRLGGCRKDGKLQLVFGGENSIDSSCGRWVIPDVFVAWFVLLCLDFLYFAACFVLACFVLVCLFVVSSLFSSKEGLRSGLFGRISHTRTVVLGRDTPWAKENGW